MRKATTAAVSVACLATATAVTSPSIPAVTINTRLDGILSTRGGAQVDDTDKKATTSPSSKPHKKKKKRSNRKPKDRKEHKPPAEEESKDENTSEKSDNSQSSTPSPQDALIEELLKQDDYYAILGVSKSATSQQIQKAYRKRAVQTHPDKLPSKDRRAFDKVAEAYDVLSDDSKRATYNRFGKRGLDSAAEGRPPSSFTEDVFRSFFGPQFSSQNFRPQPRNRSVRYQLEVTLEDLYSGVAKDVIVTDPGRKKVQVVIERGMASGQSVVLSGEMDHVANATPADLIFVLQQRPHPRFVRKGHDLAMEVTVSLQEAMCGVCQTIRHLDGRSLTVSAARQGDGNSLLIQTGDVHVLKGEGMPKPGEGHGSFGDLYIQYKVEMPSQEAINNLTAEEREQLEILLGKLQEGTSSRAKNDKDVKVMQKASTADFGRASGRFHVEPEEERARHPFGARQFNFARGNPFFGAFGPRDIDDDANVQCQQM